MNGMKLNEKKAKRTTQILFALIRLIKDECKYDHNFVDFWRNSFYFIMNICWLNSCVNKTENTINSRENIWFNCVVLVPAFCVKENGGAHYLRIYVSLRMPQRFF